MCDWVLGRPTVCGGAEGRSTPGWQEKQACRCLGTACKDIISVPTARERPHTQTNRAWLRDIRKASVGFHKEKRSLKKCLCALCHHLCPALPWQLTPPPLKAAERRPRARTRGVCLLSLPGGQDASC